MQLFRGKKTHSISTSPFWTAPTHTHYTPYELVSKWVSRGQIELLLFPLKHAPLSVSPTTDETTLHPPACSRILGGELDSSLPPLTHSTRPKTLSQQL